MTDESTNPPSAGEDHPIERRSEEQTREELAVNRQDEPPQDPPPGGAEGGDESNSADWLIDHPDDTDPLGDTDQHSDSDNLPPHREQANEDRGERHNPERR